MNDPLVYQAWVEIGTALPGIVQITEVNLEIAVHPQNYIQVTEVTGEVAVDPYNYIQITEVCVEVAFGPPIIHDVAIERSLRLTRSFPRAPGPPGPCDPREPEDLPVPGKPVPLECFYVAVLNPRDSYQVGLDWSNWLGSDTIASAEWSGEAGIVIGSTQNDNWTASAMISVPGVADGTDLLLACRITTASGATDVRRIKVSVRQQDVPTASAASWWRV